MQRQAARGRVRRPTAADERVAERLHSAAVHLLRRVAAEDDPRPVGRAGLSALSVLVFAGPRRLGELAGAEGVRTPTMSRIVDALQRGGFVRRERDRGDRRHVWVHATPAGRRVLLDARGRRHAFLVERLGRLTTAERDLLGQAAGLLERLAADAQQRSRRKIPGSSGMPE